MQKILDKSNNIDEDVISKIVHTINLQSLSANEIRKIISSLNTSGVYSKHQLKISNFREDKIIEKSKGNPIIIKLFFIFLFIKADQKEY